MTSHELRVWQSLIDTTSDLRRLLGAQLPHLQAIARHFADALTPEQFDALPDRPRPRHLR
jgi:hypothetical protein